MMHARSIALIVAVATLAGCNTYNCVSTCERIYKEAECGVQIAGKQENASIDDCVFECNDALKKTGTIGDYNPYNTRNPLVTYELENEVQAAAWMECVNTVSCGELDPATGRCPPTTF